MSVVNCKVSHIRPDYHTLKEWMEDTNNVYIGRSHVVFINNKRFPTHSSPFANPYKIGKDGTREQVIDKYRDYLYARLEKDEHLQSELLAMKGKNLGCWCFPEPCHGNVLLELIDHYDKN